MKEKTTTIRISEKVKKKLDEVKGETSCNKFIDYLIDYFLGNTK